LTTPVDALLGILLGSSAGVLGRCSVLGSAGPVLFDLRVNGFDTVHSAVIGQTGSGKSYSTGVILEALLKSGKKVLVLDPNSDFIHMAQPHRDRANGSPTLKQEVDDWYQAVLPESIVILTNRIRQGKDKAKAESRWQTCNLSFSSLEVHQRSALIHVSRDQVDLYAEHQRVSDHLSKELGSGYEPDKVRARLEETAESIPQSSRRTLAALYSNYDLKSMGIWSKDGETATQALQEFHAASGPRLLVVDLGSIENTDARLLVAANLLEELWKLARANSTNISLVVDEAHNFVRPDPMLELEKATTETLNRIAGEGRKYGLNLILMTQRPSKIHPHCLGMVSNLIGMKVSNQEDQKTIETLFGNVPPFLLNALPFLGRGEALIYGGPVAFACLAKFGERLTDEGIKEPK
jgi:DNA helicase HerA-like ATPase